MAITQRAPGNYWHRLLEYEAALGYPVKTYFDRAYARNPCPTLVEMRLELGILAGLKPPSMLTLRKWARHCGYETGLRKIAGR